MFRPFIRPEENYVTLTASTKFGRNSFCGMNEIVDTVLNSTSSFCHSFHCVSTCKEFFIQFERNGTVRSTPSSGCHSQRNFIHRQTSEDGQTVTMDDGSAALFFWRQSDALGGCALVNLRRGTGSGGHRRQAGKFQCAVRPLRKKSNQQATPPTAVPNRKTRPPPFSAPLPPTPDEWTLSMFSFISVFFFI